MKPILTLALTETEQLPSPYEVRPSITVAGAAFLLSPSRYPLNQIFSTGEPKWIHQREDDRASLTDLKPL